MNRRLTVLSGLFLLLILALVLVPPNAGKQPALTVYSAQPEGGKALRLWLEALGYGVTTLEDEQYAVPRDVGTVLLLSPSTPLGTAASTELERWVRAGGRLVVADSNGFSSQMLRRFGVTMQMVADVTEAVPATPGQLDPRIASLPVSPRYEVLLSSRPVALVPLLVGVRPDTPASAPSSARRPILAARLPVDRGELVVLSVPDLLSNTGLRSEPNARLALSLIELPDGPGDRNGAAGRIAIDELHHGYGRVEGRSTFTLLFAQAWGRAALLAGIIVLLFLLWRGKRFGRAVPVFIDRGRSLGELVTSQAALYRAGGKRLFVAEHLARQLRHEFAQAVGLPADAPDGEIAARATTIGRDPARALRVLAGVRQARSDRQLVALVRESEAARRELAAASAPETRHPKPDTLWSTDDR